MNAPLSVRQLLACLDVSVFRDETAAALERLEDERACREANRRSFFENGLLLAGMAGCAAATVAACRLSAYAGWIGLAASILFYRLYAFVPVVWGRCLCWAYFTAGQILFLQAVSVEAPAVAALAAGGFFMLSRKKTDDVLCLGSAACVFCFFLTLSSFALLRGDALNFVVPFLAATGFGACAFPCAALLPRVTVFIFLIWPLLLLAGVTAGQVAGVWNDVSASGAAFTFFAEFLFLNWVLRAETDRREKALCLSAALLALVAAYTVSPGIVGASALFCLAFLIDSKALAVFSIAAILVFSGLYVLAMPADLGTAAKVCFGIFAVLFLLQLRLKVLIRRYRERSAG